MNRFLRVENRSSSQPVSLPVFRSAVRRLLALIGEKQQYDLAVTLVDDPEMRAMNARILGHAGSTDVISLDYEAPGTISGEVYVCVPEAKRQAHKYRTGWQEEIVRYAIHGVLHLCGLDDQTPARRREMKREEDRLLSALAREVRFSRISPPRSKGGTRRP